MIVTREYVSGLAFVCQKFKADSPESVVLQTKITALGMSPVAICRGEACDDAMKGVDHAIVRLKRCSFEAPSEAGVLKADLKANGFDSRPKAVPAAKKQDVKGTTDSKKPSRG